MSLEPPHRQVIVRPLNACLEQIQRGKALRRSFMPDAPPLPTDNPLLPPLLDAAQLFTALQIPYALIGGIAAMLYGRARFTDDVDFVAAAGHQDLLAANPDAMRKFHFDPSSTWKLYHDTGVEIDIWKDEHTDGIAARAREVEFQSHLLRVADVHDLIAMKLRAGRLQDDYDIGEITRSATIDEPTLQNLISPTQFERFHQIRLRATTQ
jgi:hypothetical protein